MILNRICNRNIQYVRDVFRNLSNITIFTKIVNSWKLSILAKYTESFLRFQFSQIWLINVFHRQFLITYIFAVSLKFRTCYITDQWGKFTNLDLHILLWHFFEFVFLSLSFLFFDEVSNFRNWILTNQKQRRKITLPLSFFGQGVSNMKISSS